MNTIFDFSKVKMSWTKFDVVHLVDLVSSYEIFKMYYSKKAKIDEPILRGFVGVNTLSDPIPDFWNIVFTLTDHERKQFAFFWALFSSYEVASSFANKYIEGPLRGHFEVEKNKVSTNLRSLLVECSVASPSARRQSSFEFDGSSLLNSAEAGHAFKMALDTYLKRNSTHYDSSEFNKICEVNGFHKVLGLEFEDFVDWLEGRQKEGTNIRTMDFDSFLCYNAPCHFDFGESKEIYLVGENGDGKTVLLMALFMTFMGYVTKNDISKKEAFSSIIDIETKMGNAQLTGRDNCNKKYNLQSAPKFKNFFAYGTHRGRYSVETDKNTYERYGFMTLFNNDMTLHDPTDWLKNKILSPSDHPELSIENLKKVITELLEKKVEIVNEGSEVYFREKGYKLTMKELSEGYRSTVIFVCDLLTKLSDRCPDNENVFDQPGVVMIDEICQHLHPRWQRTIVKKLRSLFPNIQFIMTTHSPVVVLGASDDAIFYRVIRENGNTSVSEPYYRSDMNDWMLNTLITSSLFGLDSAAMDGADPMSIDTNNNYVLSRIMKCVDAKLAEQKQNGRVFFTDEELDAIINPILENEQI